VAERNLENEEEVGARDPARMVLLKTKIAELKLEQEEDGARDPARMVRLKTKIAELKLEQEIRSPTRNQAFVDHLSATLLELKEEMKKLEVNRSEHDKGT